MIHTRAGKIYIVLCHLIIVGVFGYASYFYTFERQFLRWQNVALLTLMVSPFLLPVLALYVKGIGKNGLSLHNPYQTRTPASVVDSIEQNEKEIEKTDSDGLDLKRIPKHAQKVLRTLWHFQVELFGEKDARRWGFGIHPSAPDYSEFQTGRDYLWKRGLIVEDGRGMIFLSSHGMSFCQSISVELNSEDDIWRKFGNAEA